MLLTREHNFPVHSQIYNVTIRASDSGEPKSLHRDGYLIVEVEDVNENRHAPKFAEVVVQADVDENQEAGAFVITVNATDDDDSTKLDGMISYSIVGGDGLGLFSIDDKGALCFEVLNPREKKNSNFIQLQQCLFCRCCNDKFEIIRIQLISIHSCILCKIEKKRCTQYTNRYFMNMFVFINRLLFT